MNLRLIAHDFCKTMKVTVLIQVLMIKWWCSDFWDLNDETLFTSLNDENMLHTTSRSIQLHVTMCSYSLGGLIVCCLIDVQVVRALEGDVSLEDLNEGVRPGHSRLFGSYSSSDYDSGQYNEDMKKFGRWHSTPTTTPAANTAPRPASTGRYRLRRAARATRPRRWTRARWRKAPIAATAQDTAEPREGIPFSLFSLLFFFFVLMTSVAICKVWPSYMTKVADLRVVYPSIAFGSWNRWFFHKYVLAVPANVCCAIQIELIDCW